MSLLGSGVERLRLLMDHWLSWTDVKKQSHNPHVWANELGLIAAKTLELNAVRAQSLTQLHKRIESVELLLELERR